MRPIGIGEPRKAGGNGNAAPGHFRVAVTPYYFSLIDREHPSCPVRMQVIPRAHELVNEPGSFVWNEMAADDLRKVHAFYEAVFDWARTFIAAVM